MAHHDSVSNGHVKQMVSDYEQKLIQELAKDPATSTFVYEIWGQKWSPADFLQKLIDLNFVGKDVEKMDLQTLTKIGRDLAKTEAMFDGFALKIGQTEITPAATAMAVDYDAIGDEELEEMNVALTGNKPGEKLYGLFTRAERFAAHVLSVSVMYGLGEGVSIANEDAVATRGEWPKIEFTTGFDEYEKTLILKMAKCLTDVDMNTQMTCILSSQLDKQFQKNNILGGGAVRTKTETAEKTYGTIAKRTIQMKRFIEASTKVIFEKRLGSLTETINGVEKTKTLLASQKDAQANIPGQVPHHIPKANGDELFYQEIVGKISLMDLARKFGERLGSDKEPLNIVDRTITVDGGNVSGVDHVYVTWMRKFGLAVAKRRVNGSSAPRAPVINEALVKSLAEIIPNDVSNVDHVARQLAQNQKISRGDAKKIKALGLFGKIKAVIKDLPGRSARVAPR